MIKYEDIRMMVIYEDISGSGSYDEEVIAASLFPVLVTLISQLIEKAKIQNIMNVCNYSFFDTAGALAVIIV